MRASGLTLNQLLRTNKVFMESYYDMQKRFLVVTKSLEDTEQIMQSFFSAWVDSVGSGPLARAVLFTPDAITEDMQKVLDAYRGILEEAERHSLKCPSLWEHLLEEG